MQEEKILISHRNNNFDFLRFVAASLVIISHSTPLTGNGIEIFYWLTNGQETFGGFAVGLFFIISGYLICASFFKSNSVFKYFYSRILRIFPALVVVVLISILIIGPLITNLSIHDYFYNPDTFGYLKSIALYPIQYHLPGVIFSDGKFGTAINGTLWTLSYEFTCYIMVALLGVIKLLKKEIVLSLFIVILFIHQFQTNIFPNADTAILFTYINQAQFIKLVGQFLSGMVFYLYKNQIFYSWKYLTTCLLISFLSAHYGVGYQLIFPTFGAYIIFYISFCPYIKLQNFSKYGDFSYGIYIYGFIVQQCVIRAFGGEINNILNWLISLPIAIICGILSWHLVEKRFLALKINR